METSPHDSVDCLTTPKAIAEYLRSALAARIHYDVEDLEHAVETAVRALDQLSEAATK